MTINNEGNQGPAEGSIAKQALDELANEGNVIVNDANPEFEEDGGLKDTPIEVEEKTEETPKEDPKEDPKPEDTKDNKPETNRDVSLVPAYKLKIAEDQKEKVQKELADAKSEIERLSKQPEKLDEEDNNVLDEAIKTLSEKHNVDPEFLKDLKSLIKSGNSIPKDIQDKLKLLDNVVAEKTKSEEMAKIKEQENNFISEFDKDVMPLLKAENPKISDEAIEKIREDMKVLAFSEDYHRLPLKKIFFAEKDSFKIPVAIVPKKTTENSKSGQDRGSDVLDFENMTEEKFSKLSNEDTEKFLAWQKSKTGSSWKK